MSVRRARRDGHFTVMSNRHLQDARLSLKAKGLLSVMLSLPEDWNYSVRGLAAICREGRSAVASALRELEEAGYVARRRVHGPDGRILDTTYAIYETPLEEAAPPRPEDPAPAVPAPETPVPEGLPQSNIQKPNTDQQNKNGFFLDPIPCQAAPPPERREGRRKRVSFGASTARDAAEYRDLVREAIAYDQLARRYPADRATLDTLTELMVEVLCARRRTTRVAGSDLPHETVRARFMQLDSSHIEYVLDSLRRTTTQVRNVKQYLLAALYNAPATIDSYYDALVRHDLAGT